MNIVCSSQCLQIWYFYIPSRKLNMYDSKVKRFGHALLSYVVCWLDLHVLRVISILRIEFKKSSEQRGRIFLRQALLNPIVLFFKAIWNIFSLGEQRPKSWRNKWILPNSMVSLCYYTYSVFMAVYKCHICKHRKEYTIANEDDIYFWKKKT